MAVEIINKGWKFLCLIQQASEADYISCSRFSCSFRAISSLSFDLLHIVTCWFLEMLN